MERRELPSGLLYTPVLQYNVFQQFSGTVPVYLLASYYQVRISVASIDYSITTTRTGTSPVVHLIV